MSGKLDTGGIIIETASHASEGEDFTTDSKIVKEGEGESQWIDFESDFTFPETEEKIPPALPPVKKTREAMLAETVALAQKLSGQKKPKPFKPEPAERLHFSESVPEEDVFEDAFVKKQPGRLLEREKPALLGESEKNSESMAAGCFFAAIGFSLASLLLSFFMLSLPHFPGILGFFFFELVAVLLLFASREFLKGWGYPERAFRMGLLAGLLSWECLSLLFCSMLITALWKDHTLYLLWEREASSILIAFLCGLGVFFMAFYFLRMMAWARAVRFVIGKIGLIFISAALASAASVIAEILLFL